MKLTGKQVQEIHEAILDAYGSVDALRIMVRFELGVTLEEIIGGEGLRVLIFNLITWGERTGYLDELIQGACRHNPGNQALQNLAQSWRNSTAADLATTNPGLYVGSPVPTSLVSIDVFLSYSRKDLATMSEVQETLREAGLSVWTDAGLDPGTQNWENAIEEAIYQAHAMVVLLSPHAKQSQWVRNEISFAQSQNRRIFPVLIAGDAANAVPMRLINVQWVDGRVNLRHVVSQNLLPALRHYSDLPVAEVEAGQEAAAPAAKEKRQREQAEVSATAEELAQQQARDRAAEEKRKQEGADAQGKPEQKRQRIGSNYRVVREIGEGGFGRVWQVEEIAHGNRIVAIKELRSNLPAAEFEEIKQYFRRAVQVYTALQKVDAPNLVPVYRVEPYNDSLLLVMAFMPGGDLKDLLRERPNGLPIKQAMGISVAVLEALRAAHEHPLEIVHRNIKPSNILFDVAGKPHLSDFGLAQMPPESYERSNSLMRSAHPGTPAYMAPEQSSTTDCLTPAADIYALGCVLFEMLTGKKYKRMRPGITVRSLRSDLPAWMDAYVARAVAEDHFDRYQHAGQMLAALNE